MYIGCCLSSVFAYTENLDCVTFIFNVYRIGKIVTFCISQLYFGSTIAVTHLHSISEVLILHFSSKMLKHQIKCFGVQSA